MASDGALTILMVSDFYPPHLGGIERSVADLSAELADRGHTVHVATLHSHGLPRRERDGLVQIHWLESTTAQVPFLHTRPERPFHPPVADPLLVRQIRGLIAHCTPDVVHGHNWMMCSALPLRRRFGFATVATLHDYALICPKKTLLYRGHGPCSHHLGLHCPACARHLYGTAKGLVTTAALQVGRNAYHAVDALVAISSYVAEAHTADPFTANSRIFTIPNFVRDELLYSPAGPPLPDLPADYILFVGALGRHKGIHVLLDAYRRLHTTVPLVLIGLPQPDTPASFTPGVIVLPGLARPEIIRAMDHCRFLVGPSVWPEPFGLVAIEAMARGKAVVASGTGGILDIVRHGETGLLVPPSDVERLATAMRALLDDPSLAAEFGRNGAVRCAALFSACAVVTHIENLYHRLPVNRPAAERIAADAGGVR